jgi:hypothetical protein
VVVICQTSLGLVVVGVVGGVPSVGGLQAGWLVEGTCADGELFRVGRCSPEQRRSAHGANSVFHTLCRRVPTQRGVAGKRDGIGRSSGRGHVVTGDSSATIAMTVVDITKRPRHRIANGTTGALSGCTHLSMLPYLHKLFASKPLFDCLSECHSLYDR